MSTAAPTLPSLRNGPLPPPHAGEGYPGALRKLPPPQAGEGWGGGSLCELRSRLR
jgi:hypothetical protein